MMKTEKTETHGERLLALICVMAAFGSPLLAFGSSLISSVASLMVFLAFVSCHILDFGLAWAYLLTGPFLAFIQWSQFGDLKAAKADVWLQAFKGLPNLVIAVLLWGLFQSQESASRDKVKNTVLAFNVLGMVLAGLCQILQHYSVGQNCAC